MDNIVDMIREAAGVNRTAAVQLCDGIVKSVNRSARTCSVELVGGNASNTIPVRLMASVDDGCLFIPKVDSTVIITYSEFVQPYISQYSEIESIEWLGGEYDGVPIVKHPTNANKGLVARFNELENIVKDLIQKYNAHQHTGVTAGGGTSAITTQLSTSLVTNTQQADIEHPNITH